MIYRAQMLAAGFYYTNKLVRTKAFEPFLPNKLRCAIKQAGYVFLHRVRAGFRFSFERLP